MPEDLLEVPHVRDLRDLRETEIEVNLWDGLLDWLVRSAQFALLLGAVDPPAKSGQLFAGQNEI